MQMVFIFGLPYLKANKSKPQEIGSLIEPILKSQ